tara:strand:+ start:3613 stop:5709 length:2097 start_codon:yes stop_codon:yes gene_type:complete
MTLSVCTTPGRPFPLGASIVGNGVNFALFSRHAHGVTLLLYPDATAMRPSQYIELNPARHRFGDIWHIWVASIAPGVAYAYRVNGLYDAQRGLRYNARRIVVDPYATALTGVSSWNFVRARGYDSAASEGDARAAIDDNEGHTARGLIIDGDFDWQGDRPLKHAWSQTIIYETHVRGFTAHTSSAVRHPGTYRGLMGKIPYLQELGITAVELLPVHEFNENELARTNPATGERLRNYWGYNTVGFFAPKETCATQVGQQVTEFKEMVSALHRAGIEVILDVVFNHTAEDNEYGPTLSFRGIDNPIYYLLEDHPQYYKDYTGCGNTLNCNHPVVRDFVLDCLRYWAVEMHVDGFRFDLASVLGRDGEGNLAYNPPLLERIAEDPILRDVKLIAEAWDAGGAWQVGHFSGRRWSEWNCHFRDQVRRFWRGDPGMRGGLARRLCGSDDLYQSSGKQPLNSINFITCHDGFTLNDLVSYTAKHNEANGEDNRDGSDANWSANYGIEGETDDLQVKALRLRQIKNFIATLMLSRGVPMLLGGDEFRRSQRGNNNAYCQDNELSWYDWALTQSNGELLRFTRELISLRKRHPVLSAEHFYTVNDITWFDPEGADPDWHSGARTLGCLIHGWQREDTQLCLLLNAESHSVEFSLPLAEAGREWLVAVDTGRASPDDAPGTDCYLQLEGKSTLRVIDRSLLVLIRK